MNESQLEDKIFGIKNYIASDWPGVEERKILYKELTRIERLLEEVQKSKEPVKKAAMEKEVDSVTEKKADSVLEKGSPEKTKESCDKLVVLLSLLGLAVSTAVLLKVFGII
jgi:hypothetical protein